MLLLKKPTSSTCTKWNNTVIYLICSFSGPADWGHLRRSMDENHCFLPTHLHYGISSSLDFRSGTVWKIKCGRSGVLGLQVLWFLTPFCPIHRFGWRKVWPFTPSLGGTQRNSSSASQAWHECFTCHFTTWTNPLINLLRGFKNQPAALIKCLHLGKGLGCTCTFYTL